MCTNYTLQINLNEKENSHHMPCATTWVLPRFFKKIIKKDFFFVNKDLFKIIMKNGKNGEYYEMRQ